jgi:hypothetical protein
MDRNTSTFVTPVEAIEFSKDDFYLGYKYAMPVRMPQTLVYFYIRQR